MNSFQKMETKKIRLIKNTWYCLINYIPEPPIRKSEDLKIKLSVFLRQTHQNKLPMGEERN